MNLKPADGNVVQWDPGEVVARLNGEKSTILCVFGADGTPTLIGPHTLEAFLLNVDPVEQRLVPKHGYLLQFASGKKCLS